MPRSKFDRLRTGTKPEVCDERLRPAQVVARRTAWPLANLTLGISEWHGPQNPLGLEGLHADELCVRAAASGGPLKSCVLLAGGLFERATGIKVGASYAAGFGSGNERRPCRSH